MHPRRLRAWRASAYEAGGAVARIGRRSDAIDALLRAMGVRQAAFVGAWNPGGRRASAGRNRIAERRLACLARGLPQCGGHGGLGGWREAHLLIGVAPSRALVLARRLRQGGLVVVRIGAPARLVLISPSARR